MDRKLVYTTFDQGKKLTPDQKQRKVVLISMSKNNYTMPKIPGARCFVSQEMYDNRNENVLKSLKILRSVNAEVVTGYKLRQRYIYEVELKDMNVEVRQKNFILPEWTPPGWGGYFFNKEHYKLINLTFPSDVQKALLPESGGKVTNTYLLIKLVDNTFWRQAEKDIEKIYFEAQNMLNLYQESYFLYDRSNIAKKYFVNELNQFLPFYCLVSFFGEKKTNKMKLISPKYAQSFFVERNTKKGQPDLQIAKISGENLDVADKKIHEELISRIGKKRKMPMSVLDLVIIHGQQGFDEEKGINPIDIRIEKQQDTQHF